MAWRRAAHSRLLRWVVVILALVLIFEYVVLPQLVGSDNVVTALLKLPPILVVFAVLLQALSQASYSLLTRAVLIGETGPGFFTLFRIDLTDLAIDNTVPGGGTTAAAARFRLLTRCGVLSQNALSAATIQVVGSNLVLAGLFGGALLATRGGVGGGGYFTIAGAAVLALLVLSILVLMVLDRHLAGAVRVGRAAARAVRVIHPDAAEQFVRTLAAEIHMFREDPRRLAAAVVLAAARYILGAACLWVFVAGFGHALAPQELLLAYCLANLAALVPLTPGGLGLVEGVLVPMLAGMGAPQHVAVLAVLCWRVVQFWLPIPVGALAYLSLRLGVLRRADAGTNAHPRTDASPDATAAPGSRSRGRSRAGA